MPNPKPSPRPNAARVQYVREQIEALSNRGPAILKERENYEARLREVEGFMDPRALLLQAFNLVRQSCLLLSGATMFANPANAKHLTQVSSFGVALTNTAASAAELRALFVSEDNHWSCCGVAKLLAASEQLGVASEGDWLRADLDETVNDLLQSVLVIRDLRNTDPLL